jgi:hypothetical protein
MTDEEYEEFRERQAQVIMDLFDIPQPLRDAWDEIRARNPGLGLDAIP